MLRALLLMLAALPAAGAEVAGVKLPDSESVGAANLVLNGAGLRKRAFFQVYVAGLYLAQARKDAASVLSLPGPKRVHIHMLRDVDAETFVGALEDGVRENHSEAEFKALEPRLKQLVAIMAPLKVAKEGMRLAFDWLPGTGTVFLVDGAARGAPIAGEDFYRALLRIWLGDNPVQADLKRALLGEKP